MHHPLLPNLPGLGYPIKSIALPATSHCLPSKGSFPCPSDTREDAPIHAGCVYGTAPEQQAIPQGQRTPLLNRFIFILAMHRPQQQDGATLEVKRDSVESNLTPEFKNSRQTCSHDSAHNLTGTRGQVCL